MRIMIGCCAFIYRGGHMADRQLWSRGWLCVQETSEWHRRRSHTYPRGTWLLPYRLLWYRCVPLCTMCTMCSNTWYNIAICITVNRRSFAVALVLFSKSSVFVLPLPGNKCFKVFRPVEGQLVTWPDALAICRAQPGRLPDLASITSEEEQSEWRLSHVYTPLFTHWLLNSAEPNLNLMRVALADIIIAQLRDIEAGMWIGMHVWNDDYSKDWLWVDNSEKSYENWESSEPIYVRTSSMTLTLLNS